MSPLTGSITTWTTSSLPAKNPTSQRPVPSLRLADGERFGCCSSAAAAFGSCLAISIAFDCVIFWGSACAGATISKAAPITKAMNPGFAIRRGRMRLLVEGPQLVADEVEGHCDRDRDRLRRDVSHSASDQQLEGDQVDDQGQHADGEEAGGLKPRVAVPGIVEGPVAVPPEVVGGGGAEGDERGGGGGEIERARPPRGKRHGDGG